MSGDDVKHYLVGEHVEDFNSGLISRRERLPRVTLIYQIKGYPGEAEAAWIATINWFHQYVR